MTRWKRGRAVDHGPMRTRFTLAILVDRALVDFRFHPHLLEVVEFTHLRPENMDDDVTDVDQNPIAIA